MDYEQQFLHSVNKPFLLLFTCRILFIISEKIIRFWWSDDHGKTHFEFLLSDIRYSNLAKYCSIQFFVMTVITKQEKRLLFNVLLPHNGSDWWMDNVGLCKSPRSSSWNSQMQMSLLPVHCDFYRIDSFSLYAKFNLKQQHIHGTNGVLNNNVCVTVNSFQLQAMRQICVPNLNLNGNRKKKLWRFD